jgi:6-phosphogluconolactonase
VFNAAREVVFIVSGVEKAPIVREVLPDRATPGAGPTHASPLPAQLVQPNDGDVWWMLDRAAAGERA